MPKLSPRQVEKTLRCSSFAGRKARALLAEGYRSLHSREGTEDEDNRLMKLATQHVISSPAGGDNGT